jgi:hypothetical protein
MFLSRDSPNNQFAPEVFQLEYLLLFQRFKMDMVTIFYDLAKEKWPPKDGG